MQSSPSLFSPPTSHMILKAQQQSCVACVRYLILDTLTDWWKIRETSLQCNCVIGEFGCVIGECGCVIGWPRGKRKLYWTRTIEI